jgi:hypothetical protein
VTNLTLNGTQAQTISGEGTLTFGSNSTIIVNNAAGIVLSRNITSYNLTFQNGIISTGINTLSLPAGAIISGAGSGKFVNGKLQLNVPTGVSSTIFAVGDATNYTPVIVDFQDVTTSGTLTVNTTAGQHPNAATSGLNLAKCVNRYWTMANTGIVFSTYDATFTFVAGDVPAGANPDNFIVMKWDPSTWSSTTTGTLTATTTKITGVTSFSDFIDGEAGISIPENLTVTGLVENGQSTCYNATQTITIAGGATTFVIDNGGSATMIAGQNILYYPGTLVNSGGYMLGYIAPSGPYCGGLTPSMMAVKTAVEEPVGNQSSSFFRVYPNPTTGSFTVELTSELPSGDVNVEVYGMQGNKIISTSMNHERKQTLSLEGNQPGCYFIRVLSDQKSSAAKIIKQ